MNQEMLRQIEEKLNSSLRDTLRNNVQIKVIDEYYSFFLERFVLKLRCLVLNVLVKKAELEKIRKEANKSVSLDFIVLRVSKLFSSS